MESPFAKLLLDLQDRILAKVPEIKYIDQNLGQYLQDEFRKQMLFPCILIDFVDTDFSQLQGFNQFAELSITITLFHDVWNNTSSITPISIKQEGLHYLDVEQKVFMALQGWQTDYCEAFVRQKTKSHNANETGCRVIESTYTSQFEDYSCEDLSRIKLSLSEQG